MPSVAQLLLAFVEGRRISRRGLLGGNRDRQRVRDSNVVVVLQQSFMAGLYRVGRVVWQLGGGLQPRVGT